MLTSQYDSDAHDRNIEGVDDRDDHLQYLS